MIRLKSVWVYLLILVMACQPPAEQKTKTASTLEQKNEENKQPIILFFGNSITAGYGLSVEQAFPAILQDRLDSLGYDYKVVNAGLSGETTSGGINRIDWVLQTVPDIFVLELGANDGLRGLDLNITEQNLKGIIEKVRKANPNVKIILAGMMVPPNMGSDYATSFQNIFKQVADEKDVVLVPFILDGVAGNPELNLPDGIHPTPEGHEIVADNVWEYLKPLLKETS